MVKISHHNPERACLHLLFIVIRGPISYKNLYIINSIIYLTFIVAAIALRLLEDDNK